MFKVEFFLGQYHIIKGLCKKPTIDVILRNRRIFIYQNTLNVQILPSGQNDELLFAQAPVDIKK